MQEMHLTKFNIYKNSPSQYRGNITQCMKATLTNPQQILGEKLKAFPLRSGRTWGCHSYFLFFLVDHFLQFLKEISTQVCVWRRTLLFSFSIVLKPPATANQARKGERHLNWKVCKIHFLQVTWYYTEQMLKIEKKKH